MRLKPTTKASPGASWGPGMGRGGSAQPQPCCLSLWPDGVPGIWKAPQASPLPSHPSRSFIQARALGWVPFSLLGCRDRAERVPKSLGGSSCRLFCERLPTVMLGGPVHTGPLLLTPTASPGSLRPPHV